MTIACHIVIFYVKIWIQKGGDHTEQKMDYLLALYSNMLKMVFILYRNRTCLRSGRNRSLPTDCLRQFCQSRTPRNPMAITPGGANYCKILSYAEYPGRQRD